MKPRALSEFFVHHVDGQVGCAIGANRHWLDESVIPYGSVTYNEATGRINILRNEIGAVEQPGVMTTGGKIALNPAVVLLPNSDMRVNYENVNQPAPGNNKWSRLVFRAYDPVDPTHSAAALGIYASNSGTLAERGISVYVNTSITQWGNGLNGPADAVVSGKLRIVRTGATVDMYYWSANVWVLASQRVLQSTVPWRVQMYAESYYGQTTAPPPASVVPVSCDFFAFGAY